MKKIQENLGGLEEMILTSCYYCKKQNFQARNWLGRNGSASSRQFVSFTLGPSTCQSTRQCTMQQGLSFLGKAITECLTLEIDFSANFHLIHDFFWRGSLNFPKIGKLKNKVSNISFRGCRTRKTWRGCFSRIKRVSKKFAYAMIFAFITFVKNTPLWIKNALKVWKKSIF